MTEHNRHEVGRWCKAVTVYYEGLDIKTLEGVMRADLGDWIIKGTRGEFYPCKPDVFATKYEEVVETLMTDPEPYRMARPTNDDALVIDGGKVWRPVFGPDGMWEADDHDNWAVWETFTDPHPYQNCVLTADDPEPPEGSVVRDDHCGSYERIDSGPLGWRASRSGYHVGWVDITETTVTLLYRGEA